MPNSKAANSNRQRRPIPWFGARKLVRSLDTELAALREKYDTTKQQLERIASMSRELVSEVKALRAQREAMREQFEAIGALTVLELEYKRVELDRQVNEKAQQLIQQKADAQNITEDLKRQTTEARRTIVATEDIALLQEAGIYKYRHPLTDTIAYEKTLTRIEDEIKAMARKDGGAILSATNWTVNGSASEGRAMIRDFSKLMLRAFNAEADNLVRGLKPYKLDGALDRLKKVSDTIERLGKTMDIRISSRYFNLRTQELELTSDFLEKQAEEKEAERRERERLREERKVQQEIERERARLEKERQHHANALDALVANGDMDGANRIRKQLREIDQNLKAVDFRAANIRAGYVYLISNIGSFGKNIIKIGMTRRLDPMDRIRELSDASVPFNFDVHALFFSKDAVGIETAMHDRFTDVRVNIVNRRREFFRATPSEAKEHLSELAGELLQFQEVPEAIEYRQSLVAQAGTNL